MSDNKENLYRICPLALLHHRSSNMEIPPRSRSNIIVVVAKVEFDFCNSPLPYEEDNPQFWKFSSNSPPVHDDVAMMKCRVFSFSL